MVRANKRNEALRIESALLEIAMLGTEKTAKLWALISRRSAGGRGTGFQSSQCCLLFLNGGVVDDDMARLARQVASILTNKKRPAATERSDQIQMEF